MKIKVMSKLRNMCHAAGGHDSPHWGLLIDVTTEQRRDTEIVTITDLCAGIWHVFFFFPKTNHFQNICMKQIFIKNPLFLLCQITYLYLGTPLVSKYALSWVVWKHCWIEMNKRDWMSRNWMSNTTSPSEVSTKITMLSSILNYAEKLL